MRGLSFELQGLQGEPDLVDDPQNSEGRQNEVMKQCILVRSIEIHALPPESGGSSKAHNSEAEGGSVLHIRGTYGCFALPSPASTIRDATMFARTAVRSAWIPSALVAGLS